MTLAIGTKLGSYEVIGALGAGGMGEVYRARDTVLDRDVALKILPESMANDAERVARFRREAKTLASLNHPNIGAIYGLEEAPAPEGSGRPGVTALVLELVEGPTLADLIPTLPIEDVLPLAKQIAEALEAAHELGIVHRDLKPANIKVRPDGTLKVLDFGLAKALQVEASGIDASNSPTLSLSAATHMGTILGTAAYMAPEQAKGRPVDRRADVWAFGVVLFEMLARRQAFKGDDISDTLVAVLRDDPDWSALPADLPASVRQTLRVCLQKDPKRRVRDIGAVRLALEGVFESPAATAVAAATPAPRKGWPVVLPWALGTFVLGGLAAWAAVGNMRQAPPRARVERFVITTPADAPPVAGNGGSIAISPDGSRVLYRTTRGLTVSPDNSAWFLRDRGQLEPTLVRGVEGGVSAFFSPDGEWIAFYQGSELKRVPVRGGPVQRICPVEGAFFGASWGPDGTIVFAAGNHLSKVPGVGGVSEPITKNDSASFHRWPEVLPDGRGVLFTEWHGSVDRSRIMMLSFADGAVTPLVSGGTAPRFARSGHLVFAEGGALRAVRFDPATRAVTGEPVPIVEGVAMGATGFAHYAIGGDGALVFVAGTGVVIPPRTLSWVDRQGRQTAINVPPRAYTYARLSPDGTRVVLDARDQQNDIWIWDLARETMQQLTNDPGLNRLPAWTPDGSRVAYSAERDGQPEGIYWQAADGSGTAERLSVGPSPQAPQSFSPDGKHLIFITPVSSSPFDLSVLSLDGARRESELLKAAPSELNGEISPDGRWLAYQEGETARSQVFLVPFPDVSSRKLLVSTGPATRPLWRRDGRELFYYVEPDTIMSVEVTLGPNPVLGKPVVAVKGPFAAPVNAGRHYDVSPDGKRFLLLKDFEILGGNKPPPTEIRLVQNWFTELERLVPAQ